MDLITHPYSKKKPLPLSGICHSLSILPSHQIKIAWSGSEPAEVHSTADLSHQSFLQAVEALSPEFPAAGVGEPVLALDVAAQLGLGGQLDTTDRTDGLAAVPGPVVGQTLRAGQHGLTARHCAPEPCNAHTAVMEARADGRSRPGGRNAPRVYKVGFSTTSVVWSIIAL